MIAVVLGNDKEAQRKHINRIKDNLGKHRVEQKTPHICEGLRGPTCTLTSKVISCKSADYKIS